VPFLADVVLMIAGADQKQDLDVGAFQAELGALLARYRHLSLKEIQLGPILQEITEISIRHDVPLPASLALTGKALAQMQLATAELDPTLDPFAVAGNFLMRKFRDEVRQRLDPQKLFYEGQKLKMRAVKFVEAMERVAGARPGSKLQVYFRGTERLEDTIRRAGRRLALALVGGAAWIGAAMTASSNHVSGWVPPSLGSLGGVVTLGLGIDLIRSRRRG
jgi:ubiquinone biosynthesis protein